MTPEELVRAQRRELRKMGDQKLQRKLDRLDSERKI